MNWRSRNPERRGFTLTELLVVVAVMALLTTLGVPSLAGLLAGGRMNGTLSEMGGILEQARQYAVAQNTYVWVAFLADADAEDQNQVAVAVIASQDGSDPNPEPGSPFDYGVVPSGALNLVAKIRAFPRLQLKAAGAFTSSQIVALDGQPAVGAANDLSTQAVFHLRLPGAATVSDFKRVIVFLPTGEARNGSAPIDLLEFGLQAALPANAAVFRVSGLTGQTMVYRR